MSTDWVFDSEFGPPRRFTALERAERNSHRVKWMNAKMVREKWSPEQFEAEKEDLEYQVVAFLAWRDAEADQQQLAA